MIRSASLFSQLLSKIPRAEFASLVHRHRADHASKGFTCWNQLVSMLFCHLAHADSLRDICNGLTSTMGKLKHLGVERTPKRSTLSYANKNRPAELYKDLFFTLSNRFRSQGELGKSKRKFKFKNKLLSLDSSTISLCLSMFSWAEYRKAKGGVKLHVLLDHDDYMPSYVIVTEARKHDKTVASKFKFQPGSIVAWDRAYNDYSHFGQLTEDGVYFVSRMKDNALFEVIEDKRPPKNTNVLSDQTIRLIGVGAADKCPYLLRRVAVWDEMNCRVIVLISNHLTFGASTIAGIYKERWQIEIFFKTLKQNLKVKTFVGTTENALLIQIWTALISLLLLKWMHFNSKWHWSFANLASLFRMNLFTYRDLDGWLDKPFGSPPLNPEEGTSVQLTFGFGQTITT